LKRIFLASIDDWSVFPSKTSFPNLPNSHYLMSRESHVTIIDAVREEVLFHICQEYRRHYWEKQPNETIAKTFEIISN
jgi:hypothetical protein